MRTRAKSGKGGGTPPSYSKKWKAFLFRGGEKIANQDGTLVEIKVAAAGLDANSFIAAWSKTGDQADGLRYYVLNPNTNKYNAVSPRVFGRLTGVTP